MTPALHNPVPQVTFTVELRRELPCGCGSYRALIRGTGFICGKCGTRVEIPAAALEKAQVVAA